MIRLITFLIATTTVCLSFTPALVQQKAIQKSKYITPSFSRQQYQLSSLSSSTSTTTTTTRIKSTEFDSYSITEPNESNQIVYKDTIVGTGDIIEKGKVITVAYEGRLMLNNKKFDSGKGYSFRLGEGRVIPGWENGLLVSIYSILQF
jgi:FKBP-type peptidyl-prolyl cis-trans isomerase